MDSSGDGMMSLKLTSREMVTPGEFSQARRVFGEGSKGADAERAFALTGRVLEREEVRPLKLKAI